MTDQDKKKEKELAPDEEEKIASEGTKEEELAGTADQAGAEGGG